MIKSISLLTRKQALSHEEFVRHWVEVHAPLAHAVPRLRRYVQSHIVAERTRPGSRWGVWGEHRLPPDLMSLGSFRSALERTTMRRPVSPATSSELYWSRHVHAVHAEL